MPTRAMEYRLSWDMPVDTFKIADIELRFGKDIWPTYDWDSLEWTRLEIVWRDDEGSDHMDQHATLKKWAETKEQPVKNVKLEWRPIDIGEWEPVG